MDTKAEGSSYLGASANGVNLLLGVGVLSLPYALKCWLVHRGRLAVFFDDCHKPYRKIDR